MVTLGKEANRKEGNESPFPQEELNLSFQRGKVPVIQWRKERKCLVFKLSIGMSLSNCDRKWTYAAAMA